MSCCAPGRPPDAAASARILARSITAALLLLGAWVATAQVPRQFPASALRGELLVEAPPSVRLNGEPARLAPGARIHGPDRLLRLSAALAGQTLTVHYTREATTGLLREVWILNAAELAREPWPATEDEARSWRFDPASQTWSRP